MQIIIKNKIEDRVNEYQHNTGATKTWICQQLGMSNQNLYKIFTSKNLTIETLIKFSLILKCDITDLFEYHTIPDV